MNRLNRFACLPIFVSPLFFASGCASIVSGTTQEMTFSSNPDGATVTVNGREIGKTPVVVQLKRGNPMPLTFSKEGYKTASFQMDTELNPWFWGDIICLQLYGSTTDGLSGAMHKYAPSQYMATLTPVGGGSSGIDTQPSLGANQKIKDFVVISYKELQSDLSKGKGEYLTSLLSMLNVASADLDSTLKKLRALSDAYPSIPTFADRVVDLVQPKPSSDAKTQPSVPKN
jgi:hypothetical protein